MSNDPIQPERSPLPYPGNAPDGPPQVDPYAAAFSPASDPKQAKGRLMVPGIFLILVGLMNLVPGIGCTSFGMMMHDIPDAEFEKMVKQQNPQQWDQLQKEGYTVQSLKNIYYYFGLGVGVASLVLGLLTIVGGGCMIAGRSFFLCSMGALAAIFSPGGCGLLGLAIGIWAFVVLFREDVRNAFRAPGS
jgi:hypothetical protein